MSKHSLSDPLKDISLVFWTSSYSQQLFLLNFPVSQNTEEAQNETIRVFGKGWVNSVMMIRRVSPWPPQEGFHLEGGHADRHVKKKGILKVSNIFPVLYSPVTVGLYNHSWNTYFQFSCPACCWVTNGEASSHPSKPSCVCYLLDCSLCFCYLS